MKRLLVANRGEIAVRVIRAARDLGIETVAVHSAPDAGARHVSMADHVVDLGAERSPSVYRSIDKVISAALSSGADALHPGYGFLSERPELASACADAGLAFVGPTAEVIARMGDKVTARRVAAQAGVPIVPGSDGPVSSMDAALGIAAEIGYPLLLKAAGGGGGGGIRLVDGEAALREQFPIAAGEATAAFGDPRIYIEKFISPARHIEVQVVGDGADAIHLFDRECSLQRRRQKVLEEAPSPSITEAVRSRMTAAAADLARAIGYSGAGTIEFVVDETSGDFYFMEMNTRIQVEHPTTEMVCGIDLVAEQLRIAAGDPLGFGQEDISRRGCAIELRICAEDPARGYMPSPGRITSLQLPDGPWVRVDTWLQPGAVVTPFYDSLLAKIIVVGNDRQSAIARARRVVGETRIEGIATTLPLFERILSEPWFAAGTFDTGTLERLTW